MLITFEWFVQVGLCLLRIDNTICSFEITFFIFDVVLLNSFGCILNSIDYEDLSKRLHRIPMYVLKDANNETIIGSFYEEELQKTVQDKDVELLF